MRRRRLTVLVGAAAVLGAGVLLIVHEHRSAPPSNRPPTDVSAVVPGRYVHVESGVPSTTFLPLGPGPQDGRTISAQRAYNELVSDSAKLHPIPATVRPYYGVLTGESMTPKAVDRRVWAFAVESGCTSTGSPGTSDDPAATHPTQCRLWEFVDARTGHDLGVISEEVLPD